jgi:hypothetical protein
MLLDTRCKSDATTNAVAAVNGALEVSMVIQRTPILRKMRATSPSFQAECESDYVPRNPIAENMFPDFFVPKLMELGAAIR